MDQNRHEQKTVKDWSDPNVAHWMVRKLSWILAILVAFEFWGLDSTEAPMKMFWKRSVCAKSESLRQTRSGRVGPSRCVA